MKAHIEQDWMRRGFKVWLYEPLGQGRTVRVVGFDERGEVLLQNFEDTADIPPSFVLREDMLKALLDEAAGVLPPSEATSEHLADARAIRDRLLALVEASTLRTPA